MMKTKNLLAMALTALVILGCDTDPSGLEQKKSQTDVGVTKEFILSNAGKTVKFNMKEVEAGSFVMGIAGDSHAAAHNVTLTNTYYIGETEVTEELWMFVMGAYPSGGSLVTGDNTYPVNGVTYDDCLSFIDRLNVLTQDLREDGMVFRLPTEAEWEFAAKGGNKSQGFRYSGSNEVGSLYYEKVKQKAPNELGIYDMTGCMLEWCQDWYADYSKEEQTDPVGPETGEQKVYRGSYDDDVTARHYSYPTTSYHMGFRLVLAKSSENEQGNPTPGKYKGIDFQVTNYGKTVSFKLMKVENGSFTMGSGADSDNARHRVTLTKTYYMGETEVSQALWETVMGTLPTGLYYNDDKPVYDITYNDCVSFVTKLNEITSSTRTDGRQFYLPTEAEWEFAAKGGDLSQGYIYAGSNTVADVAVYTTGPNYQASIEKSKSKQPNELGIYDMSGNVWEWCSDYYAAYPTEAQSDPQGPSTGDYRILRGGGTDNSSNLAITYRGYADPSSYYSKRRPAYDDGYIGLRILLK